MHKKIHFKTNTREELIDITHYIQSTAEESGIKNGLISIYAQGATSAIMIQENWDVSVQTDVINFLKKIIPKGGWLHDQQDGNGDSHIKSGLIGPSETIPLINGKLELSTWQNIFFCEFDGPRRERCVICTIIPTE